MVILKGQFRCYDFKVYSYSSTLTLVICYQACEEVRENFDNFEDLLLELGFYVLNGIC